MSRRPGTSRPHRAPLIPLMGLAALAIILSLAATSLIPGLILRAQQQRELAAVRAELARTRVQNRQLTEEIARLSDPAYVEVIARSRYNMARPGEHVFNVIDETMPAAAPTTSPDPSSSGNGPWWRSVWRWLAGG